MELTINGETRECETKLTLTALLASLEISASTVVVELNGKITPRDTFAGCELHDGDVLEVVTLVGGG